MPKKMHRALKKAAKKKGLKGEREDRYVYGAMAKRKKAKKAKKR
jgi:hypothetical protein